MKVMEYDAPLVPGLFQTVGALAGTRQQENQLSRTFQACFNHSKASRAAVFRVLSRHAYLHFSPGRIDDWACDVEVSTKDRHGRLDIRLRLRQGDPGNRHTICIESKVKAPATLEQLERYRNQRMGVVVLVTKERPEPGEGALRGAGIRHFRWQDVHDELRKPAGVKGKDRFICDQFRQYLEDLGMAYEKAVSKQDVAEIARVVRGMTKVSPGGLVPRRGLNAMLRWMNLTAEVAERLKEDCSGLAHARCWGPGYFSYVEEDLLHHGIGVTFSRKPWSDSHCFGFRLVLTQKHEPWFEVVFYDGKADLTYQKLTLPSISVKGNLDVDRITRGVLGLAKSWKVKLK